MELLGRYSNEGRTLSGLWITSCLNSLTGPFTVVDINLRWILFALHGGELCTVFVKRLASLCVGTTR
jgi:hypothetical protein